MITPFDFAEIAGDLLLRLKLDHAVDVLGVEDRNVHRAAEYLTARQRGHHRGVLEILAQGERSERGDHGFFPVATLGHRDGFDGVA